MFAKKSKLKYYRIWFIILILYSPLSHISCYREGINLDLDEFGPQMVIEGVITDQAGPYPVRICKTGALNQLGNFPPVSGAEVVIYDDLGNAEVLTEIQAGLYETQSLQGRANRSYTLEVAAEGIEYRGESTMPEALSLDYFNLNYHGWGYTLSIAFTDPEGKEDFCRVKVFKNGELADRYLYQGKYNDGEQIVIDNFDAYFESGDRVLVQFLTINRETFEYLSMLHPDEGGGDYDPEFPDFMPVAYANPKTNLTNNALGYFSAYTMRRYTRTVP
jgi:hypothetical protein